ncbi:MAG: hypothetical protein HQK75_06445 [Candidatus Magnetomorum sp.]|nr:hypothetical protein [Candidatus Magnetomorum sp.]
MKKGVKQGKKDGQFLIAINLLNKGFDLNMIKDITELENNDLRKLASFMA